MPLNISSKKNILFIVGVKDEFKLFKILYLLVKIIFNHKYSYIKLALLMQFIGIIGNWLGNFLHVCYNNNKITLFFDF